MSNLSIIDGRADGPATEPCPACGAGVALPEDVMLGEILWCEHCGAEIEVVAANPISLELFEEEEK